MPRIRSIKPEFWTSAQILECSTNARLLFIGIWNFADDQGRHPDSEKQLKAEIFPADEFTLCDISAMLDELEAHSLIQRYVNENKRYFYITGWGHQRIDKPQTPKYPGPFDEGSKIVPGGFREDSTNDQGTFPPDRIGEDRSGEERRGNDTKGGDLSAQSGSNGRAHRFDEFWSAYPKKRDKKKARGVWISKRLDEKADTVIHDVRERLRRDPQWQKDGGEYIPHPTTYLRNDRWEDEFSGGPVTGGRDRLGGWGLEDQPEGETYDG